MHRIYFKVNSPVAFCVPYEFFELVHLKFNSLDVILTDIDDRLCYYEMCKT